ncbi:hypothetical protein BBJ28_00003987 [Nothophytophthora sp. Chile5]|nr:hypothetical protein BBJ28_00003987 [Nothophytophthora sp. Chile5]
MESVYLDMQTQRMRVSPRAIEHGWVEEMEEKMKKQRTLITQLKLETVFELGLEFKTKESELLRFHQRIHQLEEKRRQFEIWRDEEFLDYWEVLDEAKDKEVFCIGSTDTLALIQDKWRQRMEVAEDRGRVKDDAEKERDTREHISDLTNQVALVAATAQIEQTKGLFDPVFQEIERSFDQVQRQQHAHEKRLAATRVERQRLQAVRDVAGDRNEHPTVVIPMDPERAMDRQQRKRQLMQAAKVPWHLLDQMAAERHNLAQEKAMFKLWGKLSSGV